MMLTAHQLLLLLLWLCRHLFEMPCAPGSGQSLAPGSLSWEQQSGKPGPDDDMAASSRCVNIRHTDIMPTGMILCWSSRVRPAWDTAYVEVQCWRACCHTRCEQAVDKQVATVAPKCTAQVKSLVSAKQQSITERCSACQHRLREPKAGARTCRCCAAISSSCLFMRAK